MKYITLTLSLALATLLSTGVNAQDTPTPTPASVVSASAVDTNWPDPEKASWKGGSVPTLQALAAVRQGLSKDRVRSLIGVPHFNTGLWGVTRWDYLFDINGKACQYRVDFEDGLSKSMEWRTAECSALLS